MNELDLLTEALSRTDTAEREKFLDEACVGNPELRCRMNELLAAHASRGNSLDHPQMRTVGIPGTASLGPYAATGDFKPDLATGAFAPRGGGEFEPNERAKTHSGNPVQMERSPGGLGEVIAGRYTLVEVIGEGGMGSVYLATQTEPVKRQVALKLIKAGMASKGVLARFDAERQALALMDHPNIARIYDGGVTPEGQPFFVMELVKGVPLTEYCDSKRLTVPARLQLFVTVCQAVQHAHQKGIIHRDLKPGNVLVTEVDGRPTPKVIDFGVAKATEFTLTDLSLTDAGAIVGTPAYMSPEQADPSSMDIDTRTDVYALGVMLYELLTGATPIDRKQFKRGAILEMLRMVREVEPPRPSTRLSAAEALPNIAANRSIEPAKLGKLLQGELDWVVMRALEKDRARRYDSANGFARDIQRFLSDEVVEARPPSRGYRVKKFIKRNKVQVLAASLVLLALLGGVIGAALGLTRALDAERLAKKDRDKAVDAKNKESEALAKMTDAKNAEEAAKSVAEQKAREAFAAARRTQDTLNTAAETIVVGRLFDQPGRQGPTQAQKDYVEQLRRGYTDLARTEGNTPEAAFLRAEGQYYLALLAIELGKDVEFKAAQAAAEKQLSEIAAANPRNPTLQRLRLNAVELRTGNAFANKLAMPRAATLAVLPGWVELGKQFPSDFPIQLRLAELTDRLFRLHPRLMRANSGKKTPDEIRQHLLTGLQLAEDAIRRWRSVIALRPELGEPKTKLSSVLGAATEDAAYALTLAPSEPGLEEKWLAWRLEVLRPIFRANRFTNESFPLERINSQFGLPFRGEDSRSVTLWDTLAAEFPDNLHAKFWLAKAKLAKASRLVDAGKLSEAEALWKNAVPEWAATVDAAARADKWDWRNADATTLMLQSVIDELAKAKAWSQAESAARLQLDAVAGLMKLPKPKMIGPVGYNPPDPRLSIIDGARGKLIDVHLAAGNPQAAVELLQAQSASAKALAKNRQELATDYPFFFSTHERRGDLLLKIGRYEEAVGAYRDAVAVLRDGLAAMAENVKNGKTGGSFVVGGESFASESAQKIAFKLRGANRPECIEFYRLATEADPLAGQDGSNRPWRLPLITATSAMDFGRYQEARIAFAEVFRRNWPVVAIPKRPGLPEGLDNPFDPPTNVRKQEAADQYYALACALTGDLPAALKQMPAPLATFEPHDETRLALAKLANKAGEAKALFAEMLQANEKNPATMAAIHAMAVHVGPDSGVDPKESVKILKGRAIAEPKAAWWREALALAHLRAADRPAAREALASLAKADPNWNPALGRLTTALLAAAEGATDEARKELAAALTNPVRCETFFRSQNGVAKPMDYAKYSLLKREVEAILNAGTPEERSGK